MMHPALRSFLSEAHDLGAGGTAAAAVEAGLNALQADCDQVLADLVIIAPSQQPLNVRLRLMLRLLDSPDVSHSRQ